MTSFFSFFCFLSYCRLLTRRSSVALRAPKWTRARMFSPLTQRRSTRRLTKSSITWCAIIKWYVLLKKPNSNASASFTFALFHYVDCETFYESINGTSCNIILMHLYLVTVYSNNLHSRQYSAVMVSTVVSGKEGHGLNPWINQGYPSVWSLYVVPVRAWVLRFPPTDMWIRSSDYSLLLIWMVVCHCVNPANIGHFTFY